MFAILYASLAKTSRPGWTLENLSLAHIAFGGNTVLCYYADMIKSFKDHAPPSNHLEKLSGDRAGHWSIRVNAQWRICFEWLDNNAYAVEIVDYH